MAGRNTVEILLSARDQASGAIRGAFGNMEESGNRFAGSIISAKTLIAGAFTALSGYIAKTGVDYNQMMENSTVAWDTLLGSQEKAKSMLQDISTFAKNTQFGTEDVDQMAKYMFNAGETGKQLFDSLNKIADVSGAFNIPADSAKELSRQMSQVLQANVAYTEDLNILQDRGVPIYKAIGKELGISTGEVKKMASEGKITADIYMKAFNGVADSVKGASDKQAQTFTGMLSTLQDDWQILAGTLSKPLFDFLKKELTNLMPLMDSLTALAKGDFQNFYSTLEKAFGKDTALMIYDFTESIVRGWNQAKSVLDNGKKVISAFYNTIMSVYYDTGEVPDILAKIGISKDTAKQIEAFGQQVKTAFINVGGAIKGAIAMLGGDSRGGTNILEKLGFSPKLIADIGAITSTIRLNVITFFTGIQKAFSGLFSGNNNIGNSFISIFNTIKSIALPILHDVVQFIQKEFAMIRKFWDENGAQIIEAVKNFWAVVAAVFKFLAPVILFIIKMLWDNVKGVIDGALNIIMGLIKVFAGIFTGDWGKMWEGIKQILWGAIEAAWNLLNLMFIGRLLKGIGSFFVLIKDLFTGGWSEIITGIKNFATGSGAWFGDFVTTVKNKFSEIIQAAKDLPGAIGKGIKDFIGDAVGAIGSVANELVKKFKDALGIHSPSKVFMEMGGHILDGLVNGLTSGNLLDLGKAVFKDFGGGVMNTVDGIKNFLSGAFSGGASGNVGDWLKQAMKIAGVPDSWFGPLSTIAQHESGGNPGAENHWDSNQKYGGTFGLMQMIIPTFQSYMAKGFGNILDPVSNAIASINYIKSRYGDVFNVPGIKSMLSGGAYKGYASGTNNAIAGWHMVGENGPELMYTPGGAQIKNNRDTNKLLGGTSKTYNVTVNSLQANMDEKDLVRALQRMEALNG